MRVSRFPNGFLRFCFAAATFLVCAVLNGAQAQDTSSAPPPPLYPAIALIVLLLAIVFAVYSARNSDLLRDAEPKDFAGAKNAVGEPLRRPFSLAMTQMIWWFLIILLSYLYIFFYKHDPNILTDKTLILMGIGAGTAMGATLIEQNKKSSDTLTDFYALKKDIEDKMLQGMSAAQLKPQIDRRDALANKLAAQTFLKDVLTDVNGVSLHRVQQLAWTVLLGLIFAYIVFTTYKMPEFSNYMLGVLGISGATYLGFKIPEQPN